MSGGDLVADVLAAHGVSVLFTLCGGHISPILVSAKRRGIRVVDLRHEASAVFAADATARLTGVPGVAAVTAGPGVANAVTAVKNAQLAQSPLVLLGGAAATVLKGRGSLQDIDQLALMRPHVKAAVSVRSLRQLGPALESAFARAASGVPGPVFVECPVDLLYDESVVREWYAGAQKGRGLAASTRRLYLRRHLARQFATPGPVPRSRASAPPEPDARAVERAARLLAASRRPVLLIGSQALLRPDEVPALAVAVASLGVPVYLSGMARGLLGPDHALQLRHRRREALREADFVLLAGTPCDFRLDYGRHIDGRAVLVSANRSSADLRRNRSPDLGLRCAPDLFLRALAARAPRSAQGWQPWFDVLRGRESAREEEIRVEAGRETDGVNPLALCRAIDQALAPDSVVVGDGGDFVSTASYVVRPRRPLSWLDPGVFGTLGVGAGFAAGAQLSRPSAEVWILFGDGAAGYGLAEIDSFVRHGLPVIAVVGNDAGWTQIAREQVPMLGDDVGTVLRSTDYHVVARGFGAEGLVLEKGGDAAAVLAEARATARSGRPVLVNARIGRSGFRQGSVSM